MKTFYVFLLSFFLAVPVYANDDSSVVTKDTSDALEVNMTFQLGSSKTKKNQQPVSEKPVGNTTEPSVNVATEAEVDEELEDDDYLDDESLDEDYLNEERGVYSKVTDPLQGYNRAMFQFNNLVFNGLLEPVATGYATVLPYDFRLAVNNFFDNLAMPIHFLSSYLQGDEEKTLQVLKRFAINSTIGMLGMGDVAAHNFDLPKVKEDMEQFLMKDSEEPGIYIEWPFIGPSTSTGTIGKVLDSFLNPTFWLVGDFWTGTAITSEKLVNQLSFSPDIRSKLQEGSFDPYLATQDAYLQYRENQLAE